MFTAAAPVAMTMTPGMLAAFPNQYQELTFLRSDQRRGLSSGLIFANGALFTSVGLGHRDLDRTAWPGDRGERGVLSFRVDRFPDAHRYLDHAGDYPRVSLSWGDRWIRGEFQMGLMSVSPFVGQIASFEWIAYPFRGSPQWLWVVQSLGLLATFALAGLVLVFTILTFDSRLGRVSEQPAPRGLDRTASDRIEASLDAATTSRGRVGNSERRVNACRRGWLVAERQATPQPLGSVDP